MEAVEPHELGLDPLRAELRLEPQVADPAEVLLSDLLLDVMRAMAPGVEAGLRFSLVTGPPLPEGGAGDAAAVADEEAVTGLLVEPRPAEPGAEDLRGVFHGV